jgi:hypothetical protein
MSVVAGSLTLPRSSTCGHQLTGGRQAPSPPSFPLLKRLRGGVRWQGRSRPPLPLLAGTNRRGRMREGVRVVAGVLLLLRARGLLSPLLSSCI